MERAHRPGGQAHADDRQALTARRRHPAGATGSWLRAGTHRHRNCSGAELKVPGSGGKVGAGQAWSGRPSPAGRRCRGACGRRRRPGGTGRAPRPTCAGRPRPGARSRARGRTRSSSSSVRMSSTGRRPVAADPAEHGVVVLAVGVEDVQVGRLPRVDVAAEPVEVAQVGRGLADRGQVEGSGQLAGALVVLGGLAHEAVARGVEVAGHLQGQPSAVRRAPPPRRRAGRGGPAPTAGSSSSRRRRAPGRARRGPSRAGRTAPTRRARRGRGRAPPRASPPRRRRPRPAPAARAGPGSAWAARARSRGRRRAPGRRCAPVPRGRRTDGSARTRSGRRPSGPSSRVSITSSSWSVGPAVRRRRSGGAARQRPACRHPLSRHQET